MTKTQHLLSGVTRPVTSAAMPIAITGLPGLTAPTAPDGLDLTVAKARAMSVVEFRRLFGVDSLDDVPIVGPGHLTCPPTGAVWYLRPRQPRKDRRRTVMELVRPRPDGGNPIRTSLRVDATEVDRARLAALVLIARESGRRRRGCAWSIEEIENLRVIDVLGVYAAHHLAQPQGVESVKQRKWRLNELCRLRAFGGAFADLCIGDIDDSLEGRYADLASHRAKSTRIVDLHAGQRALRGGLKALGIRGYPLGFTVSAYQRVGKTVWTPDEYDRLVQAADGWVFEANGEPRLVADDTGQMVQMRRREIIRVHRRSWYRAIQLLAWTGTRSGVLSDLTWTDPTGPWLDAEEGILYRNGWLVTEQSIKRGEVAVLPDWLVEEVRKWEQADLAQGINHPFHKSNGRPYRTRGLVRRTFREIVRDAGVDRRRVTPHHFKDFVIEVGSALGITRQALGEFTATEERTLERTYGPETNFATLQGVAKTLSDPRRWREMHARIKSKRRLFEAAMIARTGTIRRPPHRDAASSTP